MRNFTQLLGDSKARRDRTWPPDLGNGLKLRGGGLGKARRKEEKLGSEPHFPPEALLRDYGIKLHQNIH